MKRFLLCFLFWLVAFHWWLILYFVPALRQALSRFAFMQAMYWINIPGLPLARVMGPSHFGVEEFGALPAGPLEYGLIAIFWVLVAAILGLGCSALFALFGRHRSNEKNIQQA
jgi:hypothetical protein